MPLRYYSPLLILLLLTGCSTQYSDQLYRQKPAFYAYILGDAQGRHMNTEHYADVYAAPASCQKVITALLAYKTLGVDYRYQTKLYATKKEGVIHDVLIQFSGDPTLSTEALIELLTPLKNKIIHGTFILDASLFKTPPCSTNIMIYDKGSKYAQPVSTINIDKNLITVSAQSTGLGKVARLRNDAGYSIDSLVKTNSDPSAIKLQWKGQRIQAKGSMNPKDTPLQLQISPEEIDPYVRHKIQNVLKRLKIKAKLRIIHHTLALPMNARLLKTIESDTLDKIIPSALKVSDNFVFDSLYLTLIQKNSPTPIEDWHEGDPIIKDLIKHHFDIDVSKALFVDGSGLSRHNRIQPRQIFEILKKGYTTKAFVEALPSPGEKDTTLEKRNTLPPHLKAKTGSLFGINCLCGYGTQSKKPKAFVIITHNFAPPTQESVDVIDTWVARHLGK